MLHATVRTLPNFKKNNEKWISKRNLSCAIYFADSRFPADGAVELHFSSGPEGRHPAPAPTPAVPFTPADDPITRADSPLQIEEYEEDDSDSGRS